MFVRDIGIGNKVKGIELLCILDTFGRGYGNDPTKLLIGIPKIDLGPQAIILFISLTIGNDEFHPPLFLSNIHKHRFEIPHIECWESILTSFVEGLLTRTRLILQFHNVVGGEIHVLDNDWSREVAYLGVGTLD